MTEKGTSLPSESPTKSIKRLEEKSGESISPFFVQIDSDFLRLREKFALF